MRQVSPSGTMYLRNGPPSPSTMPGTCTRQFSASWVTVILTNSTPSRDLVRSRHAPHALAITERRVGAEIARAPDGAVAQIPPVAGEAPLGDLIGGKRFGRGRHV